MQAWLDAGLVLLWVAAIVQTLFVVLYGTRPWWRHFVGRALFLKSAAMCAVFWNSLLSYYAPYEHSLQVTVCVLGLVTFSIIYQFAALVVQVLADRKP